MPAKAVTDVPPGATPFTRARQRIFHGQAGQLYQDGMEDQIGALGLMLNNALVLFCTRHMDAAV